MGRDLIANLVKQLPRKWQPVLIISGAILVHISLGTMYTFGNMLPYLVSYQKERVNPAASETWFTWVLTGQAGLQCIAGIFGGWLERRIGARLTVLIGGFIMCTGVLTSHWAIQSSFAAFIVTYGILFGVGMGMAYNAALVCVLKWLPNNRGMASGLVVLGFGCGAFVFNPVQSNYINPRDYRPNCFKDAKSYFCQPGLLNRVPYAFFILAACYAALQIIGAAFLFDPDIDQENGQRQLRTDETFVEPKRLFLSSTFYMLWLIFFCNSLTNYAITALYKRFGELHANLNDDNYLAWVGSGASLFNAFGRPLWGFIGDKLSFQVAMSLLTCGLTSLMFTLQSTPDLGRVGFIIWVCGMYFFLGGNFSLFPFVTAKSFGQTYLGMNYGLVMSSNTAAGIISALLTEILLQKIGYSGMFFIFGTFSACGFVMTAFIQRSKHGKGVLASADSDRFLQLKPTENKCDTIDEDKNTGMIAETDDLTSDQNIRL